MDPRLHELGTAPDRQFLVLIHDRAIGISVVTPVIALLDECPRFLLFLGFSLDKLLDVRMPVFESVHLGCAPSFAAALHDVGDLVVNLEERERAAGTSAAA